MTYSQKLQEVRDALAGLSDDLPVYHYRKAEENKAVPYIVWQEDGEGNTLETNNRRLPYQSAHGTIDLFTLEEYDPNIDALQNALDEHERIAWSLSSVQYEDETNLIHYEWEFEVA